MPLLSDIERLRLENIVTVNCYVIQRDGECYIIDPGFNKSDIQDYITQHNYLVKGILLTHAHLDHIMALDCFNVPIFLHEAEKQVLFDNELNCLNRTDLSFSFSLNQLDIRTFTDGDTFTVGNETIHVIYTPGHTIGGSCFLINDELYTGDTLFDGMVGRSDLPTANPTHLQRSVKKLLTSIPPTTRVLPAHGRPSTIQREMTQNHFCI